MSTLGNAMMDTLFGHSAAEKMFRPWWDTLEDFVIYGLIMLGLIVTPTSIISSTPLYCDLCREEKQCGDYPSTKENPGYHLYWVRSYCTITAVNAFTTYFPYTLLVSALILLAFERFFLKIFKSGELLESFYSLLARAEEDTDEDKPFDLENTIRCVEVRQSFKNSTAFYNSYLQRTLCEHIFGLALFICLGYFGLPSIWKDKVVYCSAHGTWYECAGIPMEFYLIVLIVALCLLAVYLFSTFFTIWWLWLPFLGRLSRLMNEYRRELHDADMLAGSDTSSEKLLSGLNEIYYKNKDLRLLLDLSAATSGLAPPLRVMALLDDNFRSQCKPTIVSLERCNIIEKGEGNLRLTFSESKLARNIFSKMDVLQCLYTVQILPRTDNESVEVIVFDKKDNENFLTDYYHDYFRKRIGSASTVMNSDVPTKTVELQGADVAMAYTVRVSLVLNGRAIATAQKKVKAVAKEEQEAMEAL